jgi:uncharacterized membrane-anchored protein YjiN (DUF445 family)
MTAWWTNRSPSTFFPPGRFRDAIATVTGPDSNLERDLRRSKRTATASLAAAALIYFCLGILSVVYGPGIHWSVEAMQASAEAAMVGGIADWFAVVALFRRPLGLPIPHTGIIPGNKDRIGVAVGNFVQNHLLDPDELAGKVEYVDVSGVVATWLRADDNARMLADEVTRALPDWLAFLDGTSLKANVKLAIRHSIKEVDLVSTADEMMAALLERGEHLAIIDVAAEAGLNWIQEERPRIHARVSEHLTSYAASYFRGSILDVIGISPNKVASGLVSPKTVHDVTESVVRELSSYLTQLQQPDSDVREHLHAIIQDRLSGLKQSPGWTERLDGLRTDFLDGSDFDRRFEKVWAALWTELIETVEGSKQDIAVAIAGCLQRIAETMATDEKLRTMINKYLLNAVREAIFRYREQVGPTISGIISHWSADTLTQLVEKYVGRDLQFVRINGTLVGGLVGLVLFTLNAIVTSFL